MNSELPNRPDPTYQPKPFEHYRERAIDEMIAARVADLQATDEFVFLKRIAVHAQRAGVDEPIPARLIPSTGQYIPSPSSFVEAERSRQEGRLEAAIDLAREEDQADVLRFYASKELDLVDAEERLRRDSEKRTCLAAQGPKEKAAREALAKFTQAADARAAQREAYMALPVVPLAEAELALNEWLNAKEETKRAAEREEALRKARAEAELAAQRLASLEGRP